MYSTIKAFLIFIGIAFSICPSFAQTIGSKVSFTASDGKTYTGIVIGLKGAEYKIKYDGSDFEAWLTSGQFILVNTSIPTTTKPSNTTANTPITSYQTIEAIFEYGKQKGWTSAQQEKKFRSYINQFSEADKKRGADFFCQANTLAARFFALKSILCGDSYELIQTFIADMNRFPESYQLEKCLVTNRRSIIQQWELSCSVTTVQTYLADLCPRYAWEVKEIKNYDIIANDPNHPMAQQQKELLEKYGGSATPRGDFSGKSIGILGPLNEYVGAVLDVSFRAVQITESVETVFGKIRTMLDKGINVPLLISFVGSQGKHFILTMRYRNTSNGYQYLVYDPWDGLCDYVNESSIVNGSLAPLLIRSKITVDYYYTTE